MKGAARGASEEINGQQGCTAVRARALLNCTITAKRERGSRYTFEHV